MYISLEKNTSAAEIEFSSSCVLEFMPPILEENNHSIRIPKMSETEDSITYSDEHNLVLDKIIQINKNLFHIRRTWKNLSCRNRVIKTAFEIQTLFTPTHYLIPGVSYNGNVFGNGEEPKGLTNNSQPWVFAYDRSGIPSCTLSENSKICVCLFSSPSTKTSLESSCSMIQEKYMCHRIWHPVSELPKTYSSRDNYSDGLDGRLTIRPNQELSFEYYLAVSKPRWGNFGFCDTLDFAPDLFKYDIPKNLEINEVWNLGIDFVLSLKDTFYEKPVFSIGWTLKDRFVHRETDCYEFAWCGHNALLSRMLIKDYILTGNKENLNLGIAVLDTWTDIQNSHKPIIPVRLDDFPENSQYSSDTCNLGFGAKELIKSYQLLKGIGIDRKNYLSIGLEICDFFCEHFDESFGFGKEWSNTGICTDRGGTIGAFILIGLCEAYSFTKNPKYLLSAEKGLDFYVTRDLDKFECSAGALDTCCIDKETAAPILISSIKVYEFTNNPIYIEYAKKAAYYFLSWMMHYNPIYSKECDFSKYNFSVCGATSVSTQHHHLDMWGAMIAPELLLLAKITGDLKWKKRATMLWNNSIQCISRENSPVHNMIRPKGAQNEAFFHCRWGWTGCSDRGNMNDWLVAWPTAYRLYAIDKMAELDLSFDI